MRGMSPSTEPKRLAISTAVLVLPKAKQYNQDNPHQGGNVRAQTVCAVIVTYNPGPTLVGNIVNVAAQADHVLVIDNGSSAKTEPQLRELETRLGCYVIRNVQNLGIACALNLGVKHASEANY